MGKISAIIMLVCCAGAAVAQAPPSTLPAPAPPSTLPSDLFGYLNKKLKASCPRVQQVWIGDFTDRSTWALKFKTDASAACQRDAAALIDAFKAPPQK